MNFSVSPRTGQATASAAPRGAGFFAPARKARQASARPGKFATLSTVAGPRPRTRPLAMRAKGETGVRAANVGDADVLFLHCRARLSFARRNAHVRRGRMSVSHSVSSGRFCQKALRKCRYDDEICGAIPIIHDTAISIRRQFGDRVGGCVAERRSGGRHEKIDSVSRDPRPCLFLCFGRRDRSRRAASSSSPPYSPRDEARSAAGRSASGRRPGSPRGRPTFDASQS